MEDQDKFEIMEWANRQMFSSLYPNLGFTANPYGQYGIDAAIHKVSRLTSLEEWKFNSGPYQRLEDRGKDYLIEKKKYDELLDRALKANYNITKDKKVVPKRKTKVLAVYRRFFNDAELILPVNMLNTDIKKYYSSEKCEISQFNSEQENQGGYYIPLYAVDDNGENLWIIKPYNDFQKQMHQMILEERNRRLNQLK